MARGCRSLTIWIKLGVHALIRFCSIPASCSQLSDLLLRRFSYNISGCSTSVLWTFLKAGDASFSPCTHASPCRCLCGWTSGCGGAAVDSAAAHGAL